MNGSPIMRDHARPSKRELLAGRHNSVHVLFDINLDHCAVAVMVGVLIGFFCWHQADEAPAAPVSAYHSKFEVRLDP